MWHGYIGVENLALNAGQRQELIDEIEALGPESDQQPARLNHWRTRLDGEAAIFEALFRDANLTVERFKQRLAVIFGVDAGDIAHYAQNRSFGGFATPVVTFIYDSTDRLRFALFGGPGATWQESGEECRGYLDANRQAWEDD